MAALSISLSGTSLPCPTVYLHDAEALGRWYADILAASYEHGERTLTLNCFPALADCSMEEGARAILTAAEDFLRAHEDVQELTLLCEAKAVYRLLSEQFWHPQKG